MYLILLSPPISTGSSIVRMYRLIGRMLWAPVSPHWLYLIGCAQSLPRGMFAGKVMWIMEYGFSEHNRYITAIESESITDSITKAWRYKQAFSQHPRKWAYPCTWNNRTTGCGYSTSSEQVGDFLSAVHACPASCALSRFRGRDHLIRPEPSTMGWPKEELHRVDCRGAKEGYPILADVRRTRTGRVSEW